MDSYRGVNMYECMSIVNVIVCALDNARRTDTQPLSIHQQLMFSSFYNFFLLNIFFIQFVDIFQNYSEV